MNYYKISTFVLVAIVILLSILLYNSRKQEFVNKQIRDDLETYNDIFSNGDLFDSIWAKIPITPSTGSIYSITDLKKKVDRFNVYNGRLSKPIVPYAFAFGIDKLESLVKEIRKYNLPLSRTDPNRIVGCRIYLTITNSDIVTGKKEDHLDLSFIPVKANKKDFYKEPVLIDPNKINYMFLNTSSPCPDMCNEQK